MSLCARTQCLGLLFASRQKTVEKKRLEGVVPRDPESIKLLAEDAEDLAMSWGKPAGRMAYTSVDSIIFAFFSRFGYYIHTPRLLPCSAFVFGPPAACGKHGIPAVFLLFLLFFFFFLRNEKKGVIHTCMHTSKYNTCNRCTTTAGAACTTWKQAHALDL